MTLLVLADDDTEEEKLAVFADRVDERSRAVAPGKGHVDPGHRAKLGDALTFLNHGLLDSSIVDDARCMNMLGLTLGERRGLSRYTLSISTLASNGAILFKSFRLP